ncbi:hypothetical protein CR513_10242, partial [Mucuna pruriens]
MFRGRSEAIGPRLGKRGPFWMLKLGMPWKEGSPLATTQLSLTYNTDPRIRLLKGNGCRLRSPAKSTLRYMFSGISGLKKEGLRLAETVLDSSLSRPDQISLCREQVGILHENFLHYLFSTLSHNQAHCVLERIRPRVDYTIMKNNDQTLKELATPDVYPQLKPAQTYELKFGLIHLLPKFHGLAREYIYKHLKEFHVVYSTMRPQGISEDYIKMKVFPFFLDGAAKEWLYLQLVHFNTWGHVKCMFLEKFNKLCATCLHHQISEQLLILYFYEGLTMMD